LIESWNSSNSEELPDDRPVLSFDHSGSPKTTGENEDKTDLAGRLFAPLNVVSLGQRRPLSTRGALR